jgi:hypothetical protein
VGGRQLGHRHLAPTIFTSLLARPSNWYVSQTLVFVSIPCRSRDGRLVSARWRIVAWLGAAGAGGVSLFGAVANDSGFQVS